MANKSGRQLRLIEAKVGELVESVNDERPGVSAYAFRTEDQGMRIAVINNGGDSVPLRFTVEPEYLSSGVYWLSAPNLRAKTETTLGGASVSEDGAWRPSAKRRISVGAGQFSDLLPGFSAAVYTLKSK